MNDISQVSQRSGAVFVGRRCNKGIGRCGVVCDLLEWVLEMLLDLLLGEGGRCVEVVLLLVG